MSHTLGIWLHDHSAFIALVVDIASVSLAFVGVHVSLIPTENMTQPRRIRFRVALVILAITVIVATTVQRINDSERQDETEKKHSNILNSILNFVSNPPKQVTTADISKVVKGLLENSQNRNEPIIPDATLLIMADNVRRQMEAKNLEYAEKTEDAFYRIINNPNTQSNSEPLEVRQKRLKSVDEQIVIDLLADHIVDQATSIRDLMLKRFGNTQETQHLSQLIERLRSLPGNR